MSWYHIQFYFSFVIFSLCRIQQACGAALWIACQNFNTCHIASSCVVFVELLGRDSALVRALIQTGRLLFAHRHRSICGGAEARQEQLKDCVAQIGRLLLFSWLFHHISIQSHLFMKLLVPITSPILWSYFLWRHWFSFDIKILLSITSLVFLWHSWFPDCFNSWKLASLTFLHALVTCLHGAFSQTYFCPCHNIVYPFELFFASFTSDLVFIIMLCL